jgi:hypothetical protein
MNQERRCRSDEKWFFFSLSMTIKYLINNNGLIWILIGSLLVFPCAIPFSLAFSVGLFKDIYVTGKWRKE